MNILKEFKNSLLKRKEVKVSQEYESNPGFNKALQDIAKHFKVQEDFIVINKLESNFGTNEFLIEAFIYNSLKDKERIEPKKKEKMEDKNK